MCMRVRLGLKRPVSVPDNWFLLKWLFIISYDLER
jgi:hypothetical protein